jgi:hypothetical protein
MYQFLNRTKWLKHIYRHIQELDESKPPKCLYSGSQYIRSFDSGLKLQFHFQDVHGIDFIKKPKRLKRLREKSENGQPVRQKRQRQWYKEEELKIKEFIKFLFITITPEMISNRAFIKSAIFSGYFIFFFLSRRIASKLTVKIVARKLLHYPCAMKY